MKRNPQINIVVSYETIRIANELYPEKMAFLDDLLTCLSHNFERVSKLLINDHCLFKTNEHDYELVPEWPESKLGVRLRYYSETREIVVHELFIYQKNDITITNYQRPSDLGNEKHHILNKKTSSVTGKGQSLNDGQKPHSKIYRPKPESEWIFWQDQ